MVVLLAVGVWLAVDVALAVGASGVIDEVGVFEGVKVCVGVWKNNVGVLDAGERGLAVGVALLVGITVFSASSPAFLPS